VLLVIFNLLDQSLHACNDGWSDNAGNSSNACYHKSYTMCAESAHGSLFLLHA